MVQRSLPLSRGAMKPSTDISLPCTRAFSNRGSYDLSVCEGLPNKSICLITSASLYTFNRHSSVIPVVVPLYCVDLSITSTVHVPSNFHLANTCMRQTRVANVEQAEGGVNETTPYRIRWGIDIWIRLCFGFPSVAYSTAWWWWQAVMKNVLVRVSVYKLESFVSSFRLSRLSYPRF